MSLVPMFCPQALRHAHLAAAQLATAASTLLAAASRPPLGPPIELCRMGHQTASPQLPPQRRSSPGATCRCLHEPRAPDLRSATQDGHAFVRCVWQIEPQCISASAQHPLLPVPPLLTWAHHVRAHHVRAHYVRAHHVRHRQDPPRAINSGGRPLTFLKI